ncbi:MAG: dihydrolipoamide acetyltransferase family protein [Ktedonobacteraceae bacterium]
MAEVNMPRFSDTMQEGTISRWIKHQGETIKKGDILVEIETDKANMELESYDSGVLERILVQEGETVPIGQPIAVIGSGASAQKQEQPTTSSAETDVTQRPPAQTTDIQQEDTPAQEAPANFQQEQSSKQEAGVDRQLAHVSTAPESPGTQQAGDGAMIKASPLAKRMAEEYGIDLQQIKGSGPGGRIVRDDIEDFREQKQPSAATTTPTTPTTPTTLTPAAQAEEAVQPAKQAEPLADDEVRKLSRMQITIARRLTESKQTIPHFYVSNEVKMDDAMSLRQVLNTGTGEGGVKVSVNDMIVKACALALEKFPEVNSSYRDGQYFQHKHINIGIAVDIPAGLVVPVIRDANVKGVRSIARESKALIEKARTNKLSQGDLEGGTFSVSNLGMMDVSEFVAVINPPEAAILAVASIRQQYVPVEGQAVIQSIMPMTLSADHRILYGAMVARFLQEIKQLLQNPYSLLG